MKRFLYGLMAASLLMTIAGCGGGKEEKKEKSPNSTSVNIMDEDDLMNMIEAEALAESDEDAYLQQLAALAALEDTDEDENFSGLVDEDEEAALRDLAELIAKEIEANPELAEQMAMGDDLFSDLNDDEYTQMAAWQAEALEWAQKELDLAALESEKYGFQNIQFAEGSTDIEEGDGILPHNIEMARAALESGKDIVIQGHTALFDGTDAFRLSHQRAETIKAAMVEAGLDANHIHVAAYGDVVPAVWSEASDEATLRQETSANRRVSFMVC